MKKFYGWPEDAKFLVPDGVREHFREGIGKRGRDLHAQWSRLFAAYSQKFPDLAERLSQMQHHELPAGWDKNLPDFSRGRERRCDSRQFGQSAECVGAEYSVDDWWIGGSGDVKQDDVEIRGRGRLSGRQLRRGATCILACGSTSWGRAVNGLTCQGFAHLARPSLTSGLHAGQSSGWRH